MDSLTRRQLLQAGAVGTVAAGINTVAGMAPAGADPGKAGGIHIHASIPQTAPATAFARVIDINVWGTDDNLSGTGWDANPASKGSFELAHPDSTQCINAWHGSVQDDVVHLTGRNLLAENPAFIGEHVEFEGNLATGKVKWVTGHAPAALTFEGDGLVIRI